MKTVSIIGAGRIGGALAIALPNDRYVLDHLFAKDPKIVDSRLLALFHDSLATLDEVQTIGSDFVFITTQDPMIGIVAGELEPKLTRTAIVFHTSGAFQTQDMSKQLAEHRPAGSIHPLVSVSDPVEGSSQLRDAYFCVDGTDEAVAAGKLIVKDLGGTSFAIDQSMKGLYHAAAVTASGHMVALFDMACEMLAKVGVDSDVAPKILMPLVESTLANLRRQRSSEALTGPFARADSATLDLHFRMIEKYCSREILEIYLLLGARSLRLALAAGADESDVRELLERVFMAKS